MRKTKPLNVSKALGLAALFQFLHCAGKACVIPFITIYFRQLGLTEPFVGIIIGTKHLICLFWMPMCSYIARRYSKRRILIIISLLTSMGAGLLLTVVQPLHKEDMLKYCDLSMQTANGLSKTERPGINMSRIHTSTTVLGTFLPAEVLQSGGGLTATTSAFLVTGRKSTRINPATIAQSSITEAPSEKGSKKETVKKLLGNITQNKTIGAQIKAQSTASVSWHDRKPNQESIAVPVEVRNTSITEQNIMDNSPYEGSSEGDQAEGTSSSSKQKVVRSLKRDVQFVEVPRHPMQNGSAAEKKGSSIDLEITESFLDPTHQLFLLVLTVVAFWEFVAAPPDWIADDGVYEYLDFIDAADRYGRQWIWGYVGAAGGVCSIAVLVDNLNCFLNVNTSRTAVHFYGYAVLLTLSLLVSVFIPMHVTKKTEPFSKTFKAFNLIGSDGRTITTAITVTLTGAIGSTVSNFLFWQMQDKGSSEIYMGASVAIGLLAEVLLYFFKDKVLRSVTYSGVISAGLLCLAAQLLYYSFLWTPWSVLPIQVFNAFSNGAFWWAVYAQSDDIASPGMERPLHRIFYGLLYGLGASLGSFASGFLIERFTLTVLYRAGCVTLSLWAVVFLIVQSKMPRQKRLNYSRLLAADTSDMSDSGDEQERDWLVKAMRDEHFNSSW